MAELTRERLAARGNRSLLASRPQEQLAHPAVKFISDILSAHHPGAWDRLIDDLMSPGEALFLFHDVFTPRGEIPSALVKIYDVLENDRGAIISYNYDRITDKQRRFRVIAPHGQCSELLSNPRTSVMVERMARELGVLIPTDLWPPIPETERIRLRSDYRESVLAWRHAASVVFVGYGFGAGSDALSFEDFGASVSPKARIHVTAVQNRRNPG